MSLASDAGGYEGRFKLAGWFDAPAQQYGAHKLGMWLFLVTEILLFAGLFCVYSIYRARHPEIFIFAHNFLDTNLGALNTIILLFSSFTMAWGVRAAQLGQRRLLSLLLLITLLCAFGFLGVKAIEYNQKWKHGLLWGKNFDYEAIQSGEHGEEAGSATDDATGNQHTTADAHAADVARASGDEHAVEMAPEAEGAPAPSTRTGLREPPLRSTIPAGAEAPAGLAEAVDEAAAHGQLADIPRNVHIFFGIYFLMTGLHGLHVIAGMVVLSWLIRRSLRGDFGTKNFTAVDLGGLYWHLVDLIWIFLFPLLYLIH